MNTPDFQPQKRATWAVGGLLVVLAITGYFMGLQQSGSHISLSRPGITLTADSIARNDAASNTVPGIVSYAQVDREKIGPNAGFASHLRCIGHHPHRHCLQRTDLLYLQHQQCCQYLYRRWQPTNHRR